jgi:hypothetical protein
MRGTWNNVKGSGWTNMWKDAASAVSMQVFDENGPIGTLAAIMIFTLVFPFLGLMTALATYKVISPMIGGDVELSVISRLL